MTITPKSRKRKPKTVSVNGFAIVKRNVPFPLEVHSGPLVDEAAMKEFVKIRFPGWRNLRVVEATISYKD